MLSSNPSRVLRYVSAGIFVALMALSVVPSASQVIFIQATGGLGRGSGILRWWDGFCYVYTANHVVDQSSRRVTLRRTQTRDFVGTITEQDSARDLAQISVSGRPAGCVIWPSAAQMRRALSEAEEGVIEYATEDGAVHRVQVSVALDSPTVEISPTSRGQSFHRGMSGGALTINGVLVGLLIAGRIDSDTATVFRLDAIPKSLDPVARGRRAFTHRPDRSIGSILHFPAPGQNSPPQVRGIDGRIEAIFPFRGIGMQAALTRLGKDSTDVIAVSWGPKVGVALGSYHAVVYGFAELGGGRERRIYDQGGYTTITGNDTTYHPLLNEQNRPIIVAGVGTTVDIAPFSRKSFLITITSGYWTAGRVSRWSAGIGVRLPH